MSDGRHAELERVAGSVSRETFERLLQFESAFAKWSQRINLVASSTVPQVWQRHILDSAQLLKLAPDAKQWLDLGSGGGFPGAIIAILLRDRVGGQVDLVESNAKKAAFLKTVLGTLGINARVHIARIEELSPSAVHPQILTARALAGLPDLLQLAAPWLEAGARALFHKGRDYRREVEQSRDAWQFHLVEHASAVDRDGVVLEISDLRRKVTQGPLSES